MNNSELPQGRSVGTPVPAPLPVGAAVIDTNCVLALWWFGDQRLEGLERALTAGALQWIACAAMLAEIHAVAQRLDSGAADRARHAQLLERCERLCQVRPDPAPCHRLRCSDPNDQMFLDLAFALPARWLFSRDRAVLRLARRARAWRIDIRSPDGWQPDSGPASCQASGG